MRSIEICVVAVLIAAPAAAETQLLSIKIPSSQYVWVDRFSIDTWGVRILAVCSIPEGWRITAGDYSDPAGILSGEAKEGLDQPQGHQFSNLFLVDVQDYQPTSSGDRNGVFHPAHSRGGWKLERRLVSLVESEGSYKRHSALLILS